MDNQYLITLTHGPLQSPSPSLVSWLPPGFPGRLFYPSRLQNTTCPSTSSREAGTITAYPPHCHLPFSLGWPLIPSRAVGTCFAQSHPRLLLQSHLRYVPATLAVDSFVLCNFVFHLNCGNHCTFRLSHPSSAVEIAE